MRSPPNECRRVAPSPSAVPALVPRLLAPAIDERGRSADCDAGGTVPERSRNALGTPRSQAEESGGSMPDALTIWSVAVLAIGGLLYVVMSTRSSSTVPVLTVRRPGWIARRRARGGVAHGR